MTTSNTAQVVGLERDADAYLDTIGREASLAHIMSRDVKLTWWLLAINVVFWVGAKFYGLLVFVPDTDISTAVYNAEQLVFYTGMKVNVHIEAGQWWRLWTSQFVHLDILHILFNGYGLFILGPILERFYGARRLFVLYVLSGTIASLSSYYFNAVPSGGASGAIYGLVGGLLVFGYKYRKMLPARVSKALTVGLMPWVVLGLGIGFLDGIPMDNAAHLGGLISGALITLVLASRLKPHRHPATSHVIWVLAAGALGALIWSAAAWSGELSECVSDRAAYEQCYPELKARL
ncbi:MAG: rhomboid family intramembrane serine protease [Bradymonadaceae bacterium]|nr:rhomboid family intramembrane serine protease [Lujinxingiaceae bacterium]